MKNSAQSLALAAAFAGLLGGTSVRLNAQPVFYSGQRYLTSGDAGILLVGQDTPSAPKHSCKGKNDCKGQGGGKHPGKNDCKGKGGCATDGSKPPKVALSRIRSGGLKASSLRIVMGIHCKRADYGGKSISTDSQIMV